MKMQLHCEHKQVQLVRETLLDFLEARLFCVRSREKGKGPGGQSKDSTKETERRLFRYFNRHACANFEKGRASPVNDTNVLSARSNPEPRSGDSHTVWRIAEVAALLLPTPLSEENFVRGHGRHRTHGDRLCLSTANASSRTSRQGFAILELTKTAATFIHNHAPPLQNRQNSPNYLTITDIIRVSIIKTAKSKPLF